MVKKLLSYVPSYWLVILQFCSTALFAYNTEGMVITHLMSSALQAQNLVLQSLGHLPLVGLVSVLLRTLLTTPPHQTLSKQQALMACQPLHQTQA